jgi:hypothetical protein
VVVRAPTDRVVTVRLTECPPPTERTGKQIAASPAAANA